MTKGSRQRPYNKDKFNKNFEKIFGDKRKKEKNKRNKELFKDSPNPSEFMT